MKVAGRRSDETADSAFAHSGHGCCRLSHWPGRVRNSRGALPRFARTADPGKRRHDDRRNDWRCNAPAVVRAVNTTNPPVILLHGGPGASEAALFRYFNADLEHRFLMVHWEQRGTGRSYRSDMSADSMTIEQFVPDLDEVVELVRDRFGKEQVVLLGHSWGSALGIPYTARHPEVE
jgi:pimeloyl-ACP methyl ester carboxylesterase